MRIRRAFQFFALAFAGATLAGCVQHTATERSLALGVSPQVSPVSEEIAPVAVRRRAVVASRKYTRLAARKSSSSETKRSSSSDTTLGLASFYSHQSARTASGENFNPAELTAAHRTLPFGTRVRVTNVATGQSVTVRINDRGPFIAGRVVDVSHSAAEALGMVNRGVAKVKVDVVD
jgi:rare lipoprotein A